MEPVTAIIRHRRENLKKCSLKGLEGRPGLQFYSYPSDPLPNFDGYLVLKVGALPFTQEDRKKNLLLIDSTWRLAKIIDKQLPPSLEARSLPFHYRTAYPRKQTECPDPKTGLASVEALYLAHRLLGRAYSDLLDFYHWKNQFFALNALLPWEGSYKQQKGKLP